MIMDHHNGDEVMTIVRLLSCLLYFFYCFNNVIAACLRPQIDGGLVMKLLRTYLTVGIQPVFTTNYGCN